MGFGGKHVSACASSQGGGWGTAASSEVREAGFSRIGPYDSLKFVGKTNFSLLCEKAVGSVLFGRCIRNASYLPNNLLGVTLSVNKLAILLLC